MTQTSLRVAAVQMPVTDRLDDNLSRIVDAIAKVRQAGARLVVFPETALTGYSPTIGHGREPQEWPTVEGALRQVAQVAEQHQVWVALGTEAWDGERWVNRQVIYSDQGEAVTFYDKVHITSGDVPYYRPGKDYPVFRLGDIVVGLQICYDARFPEGYRALLQQGAHVIVQGFYAAGGDTWKIPVLGAHLRSRAAESGCFVVAANVAGPLQMVVSQIIDPLGLMLAEANQDREEIIYATLDLAAVEKSGIRRDYWERFEGRELR